jgi:hypothetical protein
MLRESMQITGREVDVRGISQGFDDGVDIPNAAELVEFAEAVMLRDEERTASARTSLLAALGGAGLVDAAAVVAAFHGFVRVADSTGIPYVTASRGRDDPELRERAGVNDFYRVREGA